MASAPPANSIGTERTVRPTSTVPISANTWIAAGIATASEAADTRPSDSEGSPVANMWCTQSPKLRKPVEMAASTTQGYPTSGVRQKVGTSMVSSATAGRKMM